MSVPTGKRTEGKLEVAMRAKDLAVYTLHITDNDKNFPCIMNDGFVSEIRGLSTRIFSKVWSANNIVVTDSETFKRRSELQREACVDCNALLPLIEIACKLYHQPTKRLKYWTSKVVTVRNLIRAWRESDIKRYSK